jgi:phosphatidate cytidylyltransferase
MKARKANIPMYRLQNWYWFFTYLFYMYGRLLKTVLKIDSSSHSFYSFCLGVFGFVLFVLTLRKDLYKVQFSMFAWSQLTLMIVVVQSSFIVHNMLQGLIWCVLPTILIISNDVWAYMWGIALGKTPLISLSPKKTMEGFIGAALTTIVIAIILSHYMSTFPQLTCKFEGANGTLDNLLYNWQGISDCGEPDILFKPYQQVLPGWVTKLTGMDTVTLTPMQKHGIVLGLFASSLAPFGGFFASGFKRAFNIKDFGDTIPGHGGITDRMDCQVMMGTFTYVYYWAFVYVKLDAKDMVRRILEFSIQDQISIFQQLGRHLNSTGFLNI